VRIRDFWSLSEHCVATSIVKTQIRKRLIARYARQHFKKAAEYYKIVISQSCPCYLQIATIQLGDDTGSATSFLKTTIPAEVLSSSAEPKE
jgi:hypothetical protein